LTYSIIKSEKVCLKCPCPGAT